ncbi:MAG TPA: hypothetical protein VKH19_04395 [Gemmatimonadaceae bacterium]|nr:hypothetical protein [Gemmatimonadaceae bacterium]
MKATLIVLALLSFGASGICAQQLPNERLTDVARQLDVGKTIRIRSDSTLVSGAYLGIDRDSLALGTGSMQKFAVAGIDALWEAKSSAMIGTLIGAVAGGVVLGVAGAADCPSSVPDCRQLSSDVGAMLGAAGGALVGALVGSMVTHWSRLYSR